jgi:hypothetical protein
MDSNIKINNDGVSLPADIYSQGLQSVTFCSRRSQRRF